MRQQRRRLTGTRRAPAPARGCRCRSPPAPPAWPPAARAARPPARAPASVHVGAAVGGLVCDGCSAVDAPGQAHARQSLPAARCAARLSDRLPVLLTRTLLMASSMPLMPSRRPSTEVVSASSLATCEKGRRSTRTGAQQGCRRGERAVVLAWGARGTSQCPARPALPAHSRRQRSAPWRSARRSRCGSSSAP